jgi:hypothetical protein
MNRVCTFFAQPPKYQLWWRVMVSLGLWGCASWSKAPDIAQNQIAMRCEFSSLRNFGNSHSELGALVWNPLFIKNVVRTQENETCFMFNIARLATIVGTLLSKQESYHEARGPNWVQDCYLKPKRTFHFSSPINCPLYFHLEQQSFASKIKIPCTQKFQVFLRSGGPIHNPFFVKPKLSSALVYLRRW